MIGCMNLALVLFVASQSGAVDRLVLQSPSCRLGLDAASGRIVALSDPATGRDFVAGAAPAPLYALQLMGLEKPLTASDAASVQVERDGLGLVIRYTHRQPADLQVTCRLRPDGGASAILGRISVASSSEFRLAAVRFPTFALRVPLSGSGQDDALLLPYCDGCLVQNPLKHAADRQLVYPGAASMQFVAALDKTGGVYLASRDAQGFAKSLDARRRGKDLELGLSHLTPQTPMKQWSLDYDAEIATLRGTGPAGTTWETAADRYRAWAVGQPWCKATLAQRVASGDVPRWLAEPSLFYAFCLRGQNQAGQWEVRTGQVVDQAERWRSVLGAPVTFMLMSWEKRNAWVTPDYFPPVGGDEAFTKMTDQLHAKGHRSLVFLSGLRWTLRKEWTPAGQPTQVIDDQAEFERRGRPWAISDASGEAAISGKPDRDVGRNAQICSATPLAREILLGSAMRCSQLGIDCVQADQIVGGGLPPCFHPAHAHPPGGGKWCARALYDLFGAIRREAKSRDRDFAFSIEEPGEFFIPVLDTYHARDYQQGRWPRSGNGILGVPLFTHVYHDYLHGYGGDSCYVSERQSDQALYQQGMNLVYGKTPAVAVWTRWFDPLSVHEDQRQMLRSHIALWSGPAHDFLVYGQRVASPPLDVPPLELNFSEKDGKTRHVVQVPSVLHSVWRLPDGRTGWVLACVARMPVSVKVLGETLSLRPGQAVFKLQDVPPTGR